MLKNIDPKVIKTYEEAVKVRQKAHAPYSKFLVGAALYVSVSDEIITGCNVENASFGATVCAERVAFFKMISQGIHKADFLVLATDTDPAIPPCALCLQVMCEFCPPDFKVYIGNLKGIQRECLFRELLPNPFADFPRE